MKRRIEELKNNLTVVEANIDIAIVEIQKLIPLTSTDSINEYRKQLSRLLHYKYEYNSVKTQIKTLTVYQSRH